MLLSYWWKFILQLDVVKYFDVFMRITEIINLQLMIDWRREKIVISNNIGKINRVEINEYRDV